MQRCCEKNQQIESFACNSRALDYSKFLHLLPNLKELGLTYDSEMLEKNFLPMLQSLRKLALDCVENINKVLLPITLNGNVNLEELELSNVVVDENTFEILAKFSELRRLIIISRRTCSFPPTCIFPPKLQSIVLHKFYICERRFDTLVEHSIPDLKFSACIYEGAMDEWIEKRNKREHQKLPIQLIITKDRTDETTSTINLNNFSDSDCAYNRSRLSFPALNRSCLTDIELEVDTYNNNAVNPFRAKLFMFARETGKFLRSALILYSVYVVLKDLFKFWLKLFNRG
ncbi:uncharacterized protein LOC119084310 [Bradysia coprophila]|uniref:uncharacterized protein LOC119084310 n=1 Tax=Bradysia coprophila TaxID=38358 RepID=UPI00187D7483|nr:uncharacterized protein LOC119084310 [Bradysia coprophila]